MAASGSDVQAQLVEKSIEAYINALETINRLSMKYRLETFTFLICNAWEILLKAKLLQDGQTIYYAKEPNRTLSHNDCLKRVFRNDRDPVRRNIEMVIEMRDEATHLMIDFMPREMMALFQTCVLNYHKLLRQWFGESLKDRISMGMMTIAYDLDPAKLDLTDKALEARIGAESLAYLLRKQKEIRDERKKLNHAADFSIDFNFRVAIVKHDGEGVMRLLNDLSGEPVGVIEVAKDSGRTHPYRQTELVQRVNTLLQGEIVINSHDLQSVKKMYGIERRPEFFHQSSVPNSQKQYSETYAIWLVENYHRDPRFFLKARIATNGKRHPDIDSSTALSADQQADVEAFGPCLLKGASSMPSE